MGRYASDTGSGGTFQQAPEGSHLARCIKIIDLGTQRNEFEGEVKIKPQVLMSFELPGEPSEADGMPLQVSTFLTNSLHEKAKLRIHLESWRGQKFTKEELERFDLSTVLGAPAFLSIVHSDTGKAKIKAILKPPKGMQVPESANVYAVFWLDEFDQAVYDSLGDGLKRIIEKSPEYQKLTGTVSAVAHTSTTNNRKNIDVMDEEIPF